MLWDAAAGERERRGSRLNAVSALLSAVYFLIFNLTYSVIWFVSVLLLRPMLRMVGHELPRGYTDVWATGWGVALLRGGLFLSRARVRLNMDDRIADHDGPFVVVMNHQAIGYTYSRLFKDEAANKEVVSVLNEYTNLQVEVYALYPQSYYIPYKLKVFLNMLQAYYLEAAI